MTRGLGRRAGRDRAAGGGRPRRSSRRTRPTRISPACSTRRRPSSASPATDRRLARAVHLSLAPRQPARAALRRGSIGARAARVVLAAAASCARRTRTRAPLLLLGADSYGRDVFTPAAVRRAHVARPRARPRRSARCSSARRSAASPATPAARLDDVLMRATDFVMVLPAIYVALALRVGAAARAHRAAGVRAARRDLRGRRRAVRRARRARDRAVRAPARLRGRRAGARRERSARCSSGTCCRRRAASSPSR